MVLFLYETGDGLRAVLESPRIRAHLQPTNPSVPPYLYLTFNKLITHLMRQPDNLVILNPRNLNLNLKRKTRCTLTGTKVHLDVDRRVRDVPAGSAADGLDGAEKARRIARGEELLGVGARARPAERSGHREGDGRVERAVDVVARYGDGAVAACTRREGGRCVLLREGSQWGMGSGAMQGRRRWGGSGVGTRLVL
jgi:hypothetical protein